MKNYLKQLIIISFILVTIAITFFAVSTNKTKKQIKAQTTQEFTKNCTHEDLYNLQQAKIYSLDIKKDIKNYKIYNKFNTSNLHNNVYSKILFQFVQKDALQYINENSNISNNPYLNLQENSVWATGFDVDNDKEEEIIGQYADYPYNGLVSGVLFIIKKYDDSYKAIYLDNLAVNITEIRLAKKLQTHKNVIILTHYEQYQKQEAYSVYEF